VGCSDAWCGVVAARLAARTGATLALDAYDNYEAYMPWNLPLHLAWRRAIRRADVVTAAGPQLAARLDGHRRAGARRTVLVPMAADPEFRPLDRAASRSALGLPADAPLLGYFGGWAANRGTERLLPALARVRAVRPDVRLVVSGRPPADVVADPGVHAVGYVDDAQLPALVNAIDVAAVVTTPSAFGRYSYPAKLCEAMACGVAVVATATEPVRWMLGGDDAGLVPPDDTEAFAAACLAQLDRGRVDYGARPDWSTGAAALAAAFGDSV
jgi:glycosyltransferase involved in cell wall biosynthesis